MSNIGTQEALRAAVENGEVLTVVYHSGTQPGTKRRIAPVGVVGTHLRAIALPQEEVRTYFVDRIEIVSEGHPAPDYDPAFSPPHAKQASTKTANRPTTIEADVARRAIEPEGISREELKHAREGTFDISQFVDPKTGRFRFPKYDTGPGSLVRIRDKTRYNRETFTMLEEVPLRDYTMEYFEEDFYEADFEVPPIDCLFKPQNKQHFAPFDYLTRAKAEIDELENCLEDRRRVPFVSADSPVFRDMERDGFVGEVTLERELVLRQLDSQYKKADLVALAEKKSLPAQGLKVALLERLLDAGELKVPKAVRPTEQFETLIIALVDVYLTDIRTNIDHFHPLYLEWVWEEVSDANWGQWAYLDGRIDEIRNERYWVSRFQTPVNVAGRSKRWWQVWR